MADDETFGQRVRRLRKFRRWTQERLAEEAELDQSTVSQVERDYGVRNIATVRRLAGVFGADPEDWARLAGLLPPLPADAMPPPRLSPPEVEDRAWEPRALVAWVEAHPDEQFRAGLAQDAELMSPEEYEEYVLAIARAWLANGQLAQRIARLGRQHHQHRP